VGGQDARLATSASGSAPCHLVGRMSLRPGVALRRGAESQMGRPVGGAAAGRERLGLGGGQGDMGAEEDWMEDGSSDDALSIASAACRVQWENMRPISGGRPDAGP